MSERWVKFTSPVNGNIQWVNMAFVSHIVSLEGVTVLTFPNDSFALDSFCHAAEPPEHFLPGERG